MGSLDRLIAAEGTWSGTSRLQDPYAGIADTCPSTLRVVPVLGGRFVRVDYTWAYHEVPQEGSLLVGCVEAAGRLTVHWIDSWHLGQASMACEGPAPNTGALSVRGSYPAPPGPDWGWRIDLDPQPGALRLVMFNISPDGQEDLAVEAEYRRA